MRQAEFHASFEQLTHKQRQVLQAFLSGKSDEEIAATLYVEPATVRRHLANVCKAFGLSNAEGEHYSHRQTLIDLFARHQPEAVNPAIVNRPYLDKPEFPGSPLSARSPFYLDRPPIEERCARELLRPGALIRIRAAKRMGKTSLVNRLIQQAKAAGYCVAAFNLRQAAEPDLLSLDAFLRWFAVNLSRQLNISPQLDDYWDDRFGSLVSCTTYVQAHLLAALPDRCLLLVLDEVDWLFEANAVASGFFALLRSWHEEANNLDLWQQLRLVVVHSTEVYIPLNLHQSPFNVGLPIRLPELSIAQITALMQRYSLACSAAQVEDLRHMVGGHPYLVQLALYHLQQGMSFEQLLCSAPTQAGIYSADLRRQWQTLQSHPELLAALRQAIESPAPVQLEPIAAYKLESMGLVHLQGNTAQIRCDLYRHYFKPLL